MIFLPTFFMCIFRLCFCLKSLAASQLKLQVWYFWFMAIFIILITSLSGSLVSTINMVLDRPTKTFGMLADSLPTATHFYQNFLLMQTAAHAANLCRFPQLFTYWGLRAMMTEERAVELCEPEDQDYHGIGGRSARFSINLGISIVFCILNPLILVVGLLDFLACRLIFGYLVAFAETPKHDLGGPFYVQQLWQVQSILIMFNCLMIGVFYRRANNYGLVILASLAMVYLLYCIHRFSALHWEQVPLEVWCTPEAVAGAEEEMARYRDLGDKRPRYVQPELSQDQWRVTGAAKGKLLVRKRMPIEASQARSHMNKHLSQARESMKRITIA